MLPADFTPQRVRVTLGVVRGTTQVFDWKQAGAPAAKGSRQMFGSSKSNREGQLVVDALIGNQVVIRGDVEFSGACMWKAASMAR